MSQIVSKKTFILLKLCDKEIVEFLTALKEIFKDESSGIYPHITLRGPFQDRVPQKDIEEVKKYLSEKDSVTIQGIGMFRNPDNYVVYFKAYRKNIEKAIYKKDYPSLKYGINPHITFYKGNNLKKAEIIYDFMKSKSKLHLECFKSEVVCYIKGENKRELSCLASVSSIPKIMRNLKKTNSELFEILEQAQELNEQSFISPKV